MHVLYCTQTLLFMRPGNCNGIQEWEVLFACHSHRTDVSANILALVDSSHVYKMQCNSLMQALLPFHPSLPSIPSSLPSLPSIALFLLFSSTLHAPTYTSPFFPLSLPPSPPSFSSLLPFLPLPLPTSLFLGWVFPSLSINVLNDFTAYNNWVSQRYYHV